jgi:hypothetical protein
VDVNVEFPELVGEDFRQLAGRAFRNGVSSDPGPATVQDGAARNSYDPPEVLLDHYRHHRAQCEKQRFQVNLLVPGLLVGLEGPARGEAPGDRGQEIKAPPPVASFRTKRSTSIVWVRSTRAPNRFAACSFPELFFRASVQLLPLLVGAIG